LPDQQQQPDISTEVKPLAAIKSSSISRKFTVAVCALVLLSMCVFWLISSYNTQNILRQQANNLGPTLAQQTASLITEMVLANDLISINVVLGNLIQGSGIAEIAIINVDNEIIAVASEPQGQPSFLIPLPVQIASVSEEFVAEITVVDSIAGYVRITLDLSYIEVALVNNLLFVVGATLLLLIVAVTMTRTYFQYLISFPAKLLSFALSNIRKGDIATCPGPDNNNELGMVIRQFNATAEFLAQNTFISNIGHKLPKSENENFSDNTGQQDLTILCIKMANYHYLCSTHSEEDIVNLLNKYYFFAGKVSQLYNGNVSYCTEGEVIVDFTSIRLEDEQSFYSICAAQLFLQLIGDLRDIGGKHIPCKFKLAVHSGQAVSGLYSPITQDSNGLMGKTLDLTRQICDECPDNALLISDTSFIHAGVGTRVTAEEFSIVDDDYQVITYLSDEPMSGFKFLLERQAIQLVTLYTGN
jgi:uncharacterized membrane protein affecting hemolysin expression|tara:strand:+ start:476 stop:1891 length:1416 start_codon:yes stop_codon:yes gene_type:complete